MNADDLWKKAWRETGAVCFEDQIEAKIQERIRTAETQAHNAAVEACIEWVDLNLSPHTLDDDMQAMRKALKRGQS